MGIYHLPYIGVIERYKMCKNHTSTNRTRKWRRNNRVAHRDYIRSYRRPSLVNMLTDESEIWFERDARKRKLLKRATPMWVDTNRVRNLYQKTISLNKKYQGLGFVVHHIVPISHPLVCGLHTIENMEIVSSSRKKQLGRKFHT